MTDKNIVNKQNTQMTRKIGSTVYRVNIHFSKTSNESMDDKIVRLIKNEISKGKAAS